MHIISFYYTCLHSLLYYFSLAVLCLKEKSQCPLRTLLQMKKLSRKKFSTGFELNERVCVFQALDALKTALQQEPSDPAVRAELHFSMGNQLREMNELDRAFQVTSPAAVRVREALFKYSLSTYSCLLGCSLPTDTSCT